MIYSYSDFEIRHLRPNVAVSPAFCENRGQYQHSPKRQLLLPNNGLCCHSPPLDLTFLMQGSSRRGWLNKRRLRVNAFLVFRRISPPNSRGGRIFCLTGQFFLI